MLLVQSDENNDVKSHHLVITVRYIDYYIFGSQRSTCYLVLTTMAYGPFSSASCNSLIVPLYINVLFWVWSYVLKHNALNMTNISRCITWCSAISLLSGIISSCHLFHEFYLTRCVWILACSIHTFWTIGRLFKLRAMKMGVILPLLAAKV